MKILFRADGSEQIGTGHLFRCSLLAKLLKSRGHEVWFASRDLQSVYQSDLKSAGISLLSIHGSSPEDDARSLSTTHYDVVVVDHYGLDRQWETLARKTAAHVVVIDDLADRPHDADVLIDQNFNSAAHARYAQLAPGADKLLGPKYAMIRSDFKTLRKKHFESEKVKRILISFGGVDPENGTGLALAALAQLQLSDIEILTVLGRQNSRAQSLRSEFSSVSKFVDHIQDFAKALSEADVAIGACGTTTWERACLGVPSVVLTIADNQMEIARSMVDAGCILYAGRARDITVSEVEKTIRQVLLSEKVREDLSRKSTALVDGDGALRVAERIEILGGQK